MPIKSQIEINNEICERERNVLQGKIRKIYAPIFFKDSYQKLITEYTIIYNMGINLLGSYSLARQTVFDNCTMMNRIIDGYANQLVAVQTPEYQSALENNRNIRDSFLEQLNQYHDLITALENYRNENLHKKFLLYDYLKELIIPARLDLSNLRLSCSQINL